jgi:uncharacterized OB-fold protein
MTETLITLNKKDGTSRLAEAKPLIKITGTLTSPIQLRGEGTPEPYYYSFIRLKGQSIDLPVIFKIKDQEIALKKNDKVELTGNYSNSNKNIRKSFTAYSYQLLHEKRIRKKCVGCCDTFTFSQSKNYDYCKNCEINGSRYVPRENKCPECGDGSGTIKFPNQPPRSCKTCSLKNQAILAESREQLPKFEKELEEIIQTRQRLQSHE